MRDEYDTREQYPFLIVDGSVGKEEVVVIMQAFEIGAL
jgi:hypothetical protein